MNSYTVYPYLVYKAGSSFDNSFHHCKYRDPFICACFKELYETLKILKAQIMLAYYDKKSTAVVKSNFRQQHCVAGKCFFFHGITVIFQ